MTALIQWEVCPKPTGPYRTFRKRGWPSGFAKSLPHIRFLIDCEDAYEPHLVRTGRHKELTLSVDIPNRISGYRIAKFKTRFSTLKEAQAAAEKYWAARQSFYQARHDLEHRA